MNEKNRKQDQMCGLFIIMFQKYINTMCMFGKGLN